MVNLTNKQKLLIIIGIIVFLIIITYTNHLRERREIYILSQSSQEEEMNFNVNKLNIEEFKSTIIVHIEGEIINPGIYELPKESRVFDAVEEAGGLKDTAARGMINLAKKIADEEFIYIPSQDDVSDSILTNNFMLSQEDGLININQADKIELETLPGIGSALADRIIQYRNEVRSFERIEDIQNVSGIGEMKYNDLKDLIKVK